MPYLEEKYGDSETCTDLIFVPYKAGVEIFTDELYCKALNLTIDSELRV